MPSKKKKYNSRFPPARIKKIMQTDEEVGKVAAAVPVIISRSLELFIESLILKTSEITRARNAKTLSTTHIKQTIHSEKKFDFLRDLVANVPDHQAEEDGEMLGAGPSSEIKPKRVYRPRKQKDGSGPGPGRRKKKAPVEDNDKNNSCEEDDEETESDEEVAHIDDCPPPFQSPPNFQSPTNEPSVMFKSPNEGVPMFQSPPIQPPAHTPPNPQMFAGPHMMSPDMPQGIMGMGYNTVNMNFNISTEQPGNTCPQSSPLNLKITPPGPSSSSPSYPGTSQSTTHPQIFSPSGNSGLAPPISIHSLPNIMNIPVPKLSEDEDYDT